MYVIYNYLSFLHQGGKYKYLFIDCKPNISNIAVRNHSVWVDDLSQADVYNTASEAWSCVERSSAMITNGIVMSYDEAVIQSILES